MTCIAGQQHENTEVHADDRMIAARIAALDLAIKAGGTTHTGGRDVAVIARIFLRFIIEGPQAFGEQTP